MADPAKEDVFKIGGRRVVLPKNIDPAERDRILRAASELAVVPLPYGSSADAPPSPPPHAEQKRLEIERQAGPVQRAPGGELMEFRKAPAREEGFVQGLLEPGLTSVEARGIMARTFDPEQLAAKIQRKLPANWKALPYDDPDGGKGVSILEPGQSAGTVLNSRDATTFGDVVETATHFLAPDVIAATLAAFYSGGLALPVRAALQAGAAAVGTGISMAREGFAGETFTWDQIAANAGWSAGFGVGAEFGATAIGRLARPGMTPEQQQALAMGQDIARGQQAEVSRLQQELKTARRAGADPVEINAVQGQLDAAQRPLSEWFSGQAQRMTAGPTLGEARSKLYATAQRQSESTTKVLQASHVRRAELHTQHMQRLEDRAFAESPEGMNRGTLLGITKEIEHQYLQLIPALANVTRVEGAEFANAGRKAYLDTSRLAIKELYDDVGRAGYHVWFDPALDGAEKNSVRAHALELRTGLKIQAEKEIKFLDANGKPFLDEFGNPITETRKYSVQVAKLQGVLRDAVDTILALGENPKIAIVEGGSAYDAVKRLRHALWDAKEAKIDGFETLENRQAGEMWDRITEMMQTPQGPDAATEAFVSKLTNANNAFKHQESVKLKANLAHIASNAETNPGNIVPWLFAPGMQQQLRYLREEVLSPETWNGLRNAKLTEMQQNPEGIETMLKSWDNDRAGLAEWLSHEEQGAWKGYGVGMTKFKQFAENVLEPRAEEARARVERFLTTMSPKEISTMIEAAGDKSSEFGRDMVGGLWAHVRTAAHEKEPTTGRWIVNPQKAYDILSSLDESGYLKAIMLPSEQAEATTYGILLKMLTPAGSASTDTGISMRASSMASQVKSINPVVAFWGRGKETWDAITGYMMKSPLMRAMFVGRGAGPGDLTWLRGATAAAAQFEAEELARPSPAGRIANEAIRSEMLAPGAAGVAAGVSLGADALSGLNPFGVQEAF